MIDILTGKYRGEFEKHVMRKLNTSRMQMDEDDIGESLLARPAKELRSIADGLGISTRGKNRDQIISEIFRQHR